MSFIKTQTVPFWVATDGQPRQAVRTEHYISVGRLRIYWYKPGYQALIIRLGFSSKVL